MKKIKFTCPNCESTLRVPSHLAGVSGPCPKCGNTITAPAEQDDAIDISSARYSQSSREVQSPRISRQVHGAGNGVATMPPPQSKVDIGRDILTPDPMADQEMDEVAARFQAPLPDVAVPPPRYEEPPPPVFPSGLDSAPPVEEISIGEDSGSEPSAEYVIPRGEESSEVSDIEPVVAEETVVDAVQRPMVVPKTQPIKVKKNSTALPPRRNETEDKESGGLPRLDVSLANGDVDSAAAALIQDGSAANRGPTRIQLPQLGESTDATSPEDFAHPVAPPEPQVSVEEPVAPLEQPAHPREMEVPSIAPVPLDPPPVPENFESAPPLDEQAGLVHEEIVGEELPPPLEEVPPVIGDLPLPPIPEQAPARITEAIPLAPAYSPVPEIVEESAEAQELAPSLEEPPAEIFPEEVPIIEEVELAPHPAVEGVATVPATAPIEPVAADTAAPVYHSLRTPENEIGVSLEQPTIEAEEPANGEDFEPNTGEGSIGNLITPGSQQPVALQSEAQPSHGAIAAEVAPANPKSSDEWDAILGEGDDEKPGRTAIVMLSVIGAVVIVSVVVFYFVFQALGGFSVSKEKLAMEQSKAQQPPVKKAEASPDKADASPTENTDVPVVPEKIVIPGKEGETIGSSSGAAANASSSVTLPFSEKPVRIADPDAIPKSAGSNQETVKSSEPTIMPSVQNTLTDAADTISSGVSEGENAFNAQVQSILNGGATDLSGGTAPDPETRSLQIGETPAVVQPSVPSFPAAVTPPPLAPAPATPAAITAKAPAPAVFPAPGPEDSRLKGTREVIEAFLDAPNWSERVKYIYQGESIKPAVEEYYKKWPDTKLERYSLQFFLIEEDASSGQPYWMYLMSTSDDEEGIPVLVRIENGNLKVDWEIFSEFQDRHYVKFMEGGIASPHTLRLVCERQSDYYGSDRDGFTDLKDYLVFKVFPPYGDDTALAENAFVKKGTPLAEKLSNTIGLGDEPLGVIVTLDHFAFPHGIKHLIIKDFITEGWFK